VNELRAAEQQGTAVIDQETFLLPSRPASARDVLLTRRLRCAARFRGGTLSPTALIGVVAAMGVPGSHDARSAHPLALEQERLGESQRL
jgi:hypothetical protein